jgi:hypothetical protein
MRFSERYRHKPVREAIQLDSIDEALKNGIWSLLGVFYWDKAVYSSSVTGYDGSGCSLSSSPNRDLSSLCNALWFSYFKKPLDRLADDWEKVLQQLRDYFFQAQWYEVYDFIEFVSNNFPQDYHETNKKFMTACNHIFEREMGAYRFVGGQITKIVEEEEIKSIEEAIGESEKLVAMHLRRSLELLSDRSNPDFRNSVKESISAVERLASHRTGEEHGTLGQLLKKLEGPIELHPALKNAFNSLYGWTSDDSGIRHALSEKETVDFEDAKFMLVACSAFINYVEGKLKDGG